MVGKTPQADLQGDGNEFEVTAASIKLVFASDGSLYREVSASFLGTERLDTDVGVDMTVEFGFKLTTNGKYVVSGSTLEVISGDQVNFDWNLLDVSYDVDTRGVPVLEELQQELNEKAEEFEQEFREELNEAELEQRYREEFGLDLTTYTWTLENDLLTLTNGDQEVYRKK